MAHPSSTCKGNSNKTARHKENVLKFVMARNCGVLTLFSVNLRRMLVCEKGLGGIWSYLIVWHEIVGATYESAE